jgi:hypothetical protein
MELKTLPPVAAMSGLIRTLAGRVHFNRDRVGDELVMENGERHRVFREVRVDPHRMAPPESVVTLTLRFQFARFSQAANQRLSLLPIPVIIGMPGFLKKTWTWCDETGYSQGIYLFASAGQAEAYRRSPVIRVLKKRTVKGSYSWTLDSVREDSAEPATGRVN